MRLLVACPQCKRQFDATGRAVGSRFRCHCGTVLKIRRPHGHDAAVVRCSSCGGPRQEQSTACGYCGADFTIHEQDLNTVCPQCLARVSDRAKYCHHCGVALVPETLAGANTSYPCPACDGASRLRHRQIGGVALLECPRCAGFWVARNVFDHLVEQASRNALGLDLRANAPTPGGNSARNGEKWSYRQCPHCRKLMSRINYGRRSGVIVDRCREHGVWFDIDELAQILDWVRLGGLKEARRCQAEDAARQKQRESLAKLAKIKGPFTRELHEVDDSPSDWLWIVGNLAVVVARLLHR